MSSPGSIRSEKATITHSQPRLGTASVFRTDSYLADDRVKLTWRSWMVVFITSLAIFSQTFVVVAAGSVIDFSQTFVIVVAGSVIAFIIRDLGEPAISGLSNTESVQ